MDGPALQRVNVRAFRATCSCPLDGPFPRMLPLRPQRIWAGGGKRASWHLPSLHPQAARQEWARIPKLHQCARHLLKGCARHPLALCPAGTHISRVHTHLGVCPKEADLSQGSPPGCVHTTPGSPRPSCHPQARLSALSHDPPRAPVFMAHQGTEEMPDGPQLPAGTSLREHNPPSPVQVSEPMVGEGPAPPQPFLRPGYLFVCFVFLNTTLMYFTICFYIYIFRERQEG